MDHIKTCNVLTFHHKHRHLEAVLLKVETYKRIASTQKSTVSLRKAHIGQVPT